MSWVGLASLVLALVLLGVVIAAVLWWDRRRAATALFARRAVLAELQRDPALAAVRVRVATRIEWSGETIVELDGTVTSPWYRYAVIRAAQRALAREPVPARVVDRIVVARERARAKRAST